MANMLVNIDVDDLARGVDFYTRAFGLRVGRRFGAAAVELLGGEAPLYLLAKAGGTAATAQPRGAPRDYGRHWTPLHLDFVVVDIHAAMKAVLEAGAAQEGALLTHAWGHIATFSDPFGHGFCLLQFLGGGYDDVAT
jgi:predicted enzyme related to lactoylglutathione lyase